MVDLNHVLLFSKVVETGSFSGAARALGLPRATVSRQVARLESDLGARLLHRTTRKVELTRLGRAYHEEVRGGLDQLSTAEERLATEQAVPSGTLRVTAPVEFGSRGLMDWLPEFLAAYPKVGLQLDLRDDLVDLIDARIDVAFRTGRLQSSSLIARKLGSTRRILLASPTYLRRRGSPRGVRDLRKHDCVLFGSAGTKATWRLDGPQGRREVQVAGRIAVNSAGAALRAAAEGLGVALLPAALARDELERGTLRQILPRYGVEGGGLYLVYPSKRHPSAALRAFLDFCEERLRSW